MDDAKSIFANIPDIWFDWYARLIPGVVGVVLYLSLDGYRIFNFSATKILVMIFMAYAAGHVIQPPSSLISKIIEKKFGSDLKYTAAKTTATNGVTLDSLKKISKAHAECVSMISCAIMTLMNLIYFWNSENLNRPLAVFSILYFIIFSIERAYARMRKIGDLPG